MDQDQQEKQRHVCKYCNKSFANGKVLGGHMRCHVTKNPLKNQKKLNDSALVNDGGERAGYGLRVNPKKSSRVSASSDQETTSSSSSKGVPCGVCGKGFDSMRALFGHMRHHTKRRREMVCCCRECGREFVSLRALCCHMKTHSDPKRGLMEKRLFAESSGLVKRKRSRRSRLRFGANCSALSLSESSSTLGGDADPEAEEIAVCLLLLSKGGWGEDEFFPAEFSEGTNSSGLEAKSANRGGTLVFECTDDKKMGIDQRLEFGVVSGCHGGFLEGKKLRDLRENGEEKEGLSLGVSDLKLGGDRDVMGLMIINPLEMESDESVAKFISEEKPGLDQNNADQLRLTDSGHPTLESSHRGSEYKCRTCNKIFHSHQALGGHQTIHRSAKSFPSLQFEDFPGIEEEDSVGLEAERVVTTTSFESNNKEHKCHICFKVFASGQALGGHKRAHMVRDSEAEEAEKIPLLSHEGCGISSEHVLGTDVELIKSSSSPWWARDSHKHELLVGLMPN